MSRFKESGLDGQKITYRFIPKRGRVRRHLPLAPMTAPSFFASTGTKDLTKSTGSAGTTGTTTTGATAAVVVAADEVAAVAEVAAAGVEAGAVAGGARPAAAVAADWSGSGFFVLVLRLSSTTAHTSGFPASLAGGPGASVSAGMTTAMVVVSPFTTGSSCFFRREWERAY